MQVRIYIPAKSATQSGDGYSHWLLEFVTKNDAKFKEALMGRTSSNDMANEVKIKFPSLLEAKEFAQKQGYNYEIIMPKERKLIKKSYASNFG